MGVNVTEELSYFIAQSDEDNNTLQIRSPEGALVVEFEEFSTEEETQAEIITDWLNWERNRNRTPSQEEEEEEVEKEVAEATGMTEERVRELADSTTGLTVGHLGEFARALKKVMDERDRLEDRLRNLLETGEG